MLGNYGQMGNAMARILSKFDWNLLGLLYHNFLEKKAKGNSDCHHTLSAIIYHFNKSDTTIKRDFDEQEVTREQLVEHLNFLKTKSRSKFFLYILFVQIRF